MSIPFPGSWSPKDEQGQKGCQIKNKYKFKFVFSHSVVSNSLQLHELKNTRLLCPSLSPGSCSDSCPLSWWCHPTISSSVVPFTSCLQSFLALGSFPMSWLFASGGQSIGVSTSASVLPVNIQDWFPLGLTGWISLQSKGLSRVFSNTTVQKHQFFGTQLSLQSNSHIYTWLLGKTIALTGQTFVGKVMSLLFKMLSRVVINFLPRSKCLLISLVQSPSAVMLDRVQKIIYFWVLWSCMYHFSNMQIILIDHTRIKLLIPC